MRIAQSEDGKYRLSIKDKHGNIINGVILIFQKSGGGKSLFSEATAEEYNNVGKHIFISLLDVKDESEHAFAMFEPKAKYHLEKLKKEGKQPTKKEVIVYHPNTLTIPKTLIPKTRFYTHSIKKVLNRDTISILTESHTGTDTVELIISAVNEIKNTGNIWDLVHQVQKSVKTKTKSYHGKEIIQPDETNFFLETGKKGTKLNVSEVASIFDTFKTNYALTPDNYPLNLDVEKEIFQQPNKYHVLTTTHIRDKKTKYFYITCFFDQILQNIKKSKYPLVILIDEIGSLVPRDYTSGYQIQLGDYFGENLMTIRNRGRGVTIIGTSQVYSNIGEKIRGKGSTKLFGRMESTDDIDKLAKAKIGKNTIQSLRTMEAGTYILSGEEKAQEIKSFFPTHCHKETGYNFNEEYQKHYPNQMTKYTETINQTKTHIKQIQEYYKTKTQEKLKQQIQENKEAQEAKKEQTKTEDKLTQLKEKYQQTKTTNKQEKIKQANELRTKGLSIRKIAEVLGISKSTAKNYIDKKQEEPPINIKREDINYKDIK